MGNGELRPPTRLTPFDRSPIICNIWLGRPDEPLCQICCKSAVGGLLWNWVKYHVFYLYPFGGTHPQVRPVDGFSHLMAHSTDSRVLGFRWYRSHLAGQVTQNPILEARIGIFNGHHFEVANRISTKFCYRVYVQKQSLWVRIFVLTSGRSDVRFHKYQHQYRYLRSGYGGIWTRFRLRRRIGHVHNANGDRSKTTKIIRRWY